MRTKLLILSIVTLFTLSLVTASIAAGTPTDAIKGTVDSVLDTMRDKSLSQPDKKQERREKISAAIKARFNFEEMSKRSLAKHWKEINDDERAEFVKIFAELLEASYISKIESYTDEKVAYNKETVKGDGKYGIVETMIITKSVEIPIDYKLISKNGEWWVYDVIIEGVSFISTYRSQYNRIIVKDSFAKLLESMKTKLEEVKANDSKEAS